MRITSVGVALAGTTLLTRAALPLGWDGMFEEDAAGIVGMFFLFASVAGGIAGLLVATARLSSFVSTHSRSALARVLPSFLLVAISLVVLWPVELLVAPFEANDHTGDSSGRLIEAVAGWLAYVAIAHLVQAVMTRAGRSLSPSRARR